MARYCQTEQLPEIQLQKAPLHGTVRFINGYGQPVDCPNPVGAVNVFYKPATGFVGEDQFIVHRKGDYWSHDIDHQLTIMVTAQ